MMVLVGPHHRWLCWAQNGMGRRWEGLESEDQHLPGNTAAPVTLEKQATKALSVPLSSYKKIFKIKHQVPLATMWIMDSRKQVGKAKGARLFTLG